MKTVILALITGLSFSSITFAINPVDSLPAAVAKKHLATTDSDCQTDLFQDSESFDLGQGNKLYLVPCYMGAYQGSSFGYIANGESVTSITVLAYDDSVKGIVADMNLSEAAFDPKIKTLSTFAKGRGLGDCGQTSKSLITVTPYGRVAVKTVEIRNKSKCDGRMSNWPIVFKQK